MGIALIKWLVLALLVAGTFGVVWTAPWKDDVERLTGSARDTVDAARRTLGALDGATGGECSTVGRAAPARTRAAAEVLAAQAQATPDARADESSDATIRDVARRHAEQIGRCLERVTQAGPGWEDLQRRLERAAAG